MTTPPSDDNPFRTPDYATPAAPPPFTPAPMPPAPGGATPAGRPSIPHWFSTKVRITLVACVVGALALGSLGAMSIYWLHRSGPPTDGDCLYLSREGAGKLAYHRVGCGEDGATYKVDDSYRGSFRCGSGDYVRFQITGTGSATERTLCLALNVRSGECLRDIDDEATIAKVGCTDPAAKVRATVVSGYGGEDDCGEADKVLVYGGPPRRTVCLAPTGESI